MRQAQTDSVTASAALLLILIAGLLPAYSASAERPTAPGKSAEKSEAAVKPLDPLSMEFQAEQKVLKDAKSFPIAQDIAKKVQDMVDAKDYAGLDAYAAKLRAAKSAYASGFEQLDSFYSSFAKRFKRNAPVSPYENLITFCTDWMKANPKSPTAPVVLINVWREYAWRAKETVNGVKPSEDDLKNYPIRLHEAEKVFEEAKNLPEQCPHLYSSELIVAKDLQYDHSAFDKVFNDGVKLFPQYFSLYAQKLAYLMPTAMGALNEMEDFVSNQADKIGGIPGDIFYGRMVWQADRDKWDQKIFEKTKFSWSRTKKGLEELLRETDDPIRVQAELAKLAHSDGDDATAKVYYDQVLKK
jgi:hypothetical protein